MKYCVDIKPGACMDKVSILIEMTFGNEILSLDRFLDYLIVNSENEKTLWVEGVSNVQPEFDLAYKERP
jgi:hypothetical protein